MTCRVCGHRKRLEIDRALLEGQSLRGIARRTTGLSASSLQRHKADHLVPSLVKVYQAKENARAEGFRERLETTWEAIQGAMDQAQRAVRTHEDGTVEDRSLSVLPPLFNQAHRNLELLGRATGELSNDGAPATNVTLIRVLSVPRMPGVQTIHAIAEGAPPAAETTEAVRSLPAAEVDAPVDSDTPDIPGRNRR
jgi:hypothetical protein